MELKKRYPEDSKFKGSLSKLYLDNKDLHMSAINVLISRVYDMNAKEYFVSKGIMEEKSNEIKPKPEKVEKEKPKDTPKKL